MDCHKWKGKRLEDVGKENTEKNIRTNIRKWLLDNKNELRNESRLSKCK
jgi:hypothetical protein